ncbi:hypothetical protein ACXWQM_09960, partial [Streptococcus pyogenes]
GLARAFGGLSGRGTGGAGMTQALSPAQIVRSGLCIGCGACASGADATMAWDDYGQLKPSGPASLRRSEGFAALCPFSPEATN